MTKTRPQNPQNVVERASDELAACAVNLRTAATPGEVDYWRGRLDGYNIAIGHLLHPAKRGPIEDRALAKVEAAKANAVGRATMVLPTRYIKEAIRERRAAGS